MIDNSKIAYHYLNEFGSVIDLNKINPNPGKKTFLVLDSSVCLDIISIVNKKHINKESRRKAFELIKYSYKKSMQIFEILALLELSTDKSTYKLNTEKFLDFSNKLNFAFHFPLERLRKNEFDYLINFKEPKKIEIQDNPKDIIEQILIHYCALLKIREIACKGLGKHNSKKNILEFIHWMNSELNLILGLEYQLAIQIFGGNNGFNTMIKENSTKENALKALWGTAWDLFHARVGRNSGQLSEIISEDINTMFITNDRKLYELIAPQIELASKYDRSKITLTTGEENHPPHFDDAFMSHLNEIILEIYEGRVLNKVIYPNNDFIKNLIYNMEEKIPLNVCEKISQKQVNPNI